MNPDSNIPPQKITSDTNMTKVYQPKKSGVSIYDKEKKKMVHFKDPYGAKAKKAYIHYLNLGYEPGSVLPKDLKWHPKGPTSSRDTFRRIKSKKPESIEGRTAYKNFLASFTIQNSMNLKKLNGFKLADRFLPTLEKYLTEHNGIKFYFNARYEMHRVLNGKVIERDVEWWKTSLIKSINNASQLEDAIKSSKNFLIEAIPEMEKKGSGWTFHKVLTMELHIGRYKAIKGGSYIKLPQSIVSKRATINVMNKDHECFKWSVLSALFPAKKNFERVGNYKKHQGKLDFSGISYPTPLSDIPKFERRNKISINVYGYTMQKEKLKGDLFLKSKLGSKETKKEIQANRKEWASTYLLQKSKEHANAEKHLDLLLVHDAKEGNSHYCWIKNFSRFCGSASNHNHGGRKYYCNYCIQGFASQAKLDNHLESGCAEITTCKPCMPPTDKAFIEFKNFENSCKAPFVIYADFECLLTPISKCTKSTVDSYTDAYQKHESCGFTLYVVGAGLPPGKFKPYVYRGKNTVEEFIVVLKKFEERLMKEIKSNTPMIMSTQDEVDFQAATCCSFCNKDLGTDRVRDHDHLTGKYRGASHNQCNLTEGIKRTKNYKVPVFFHNLKGYDSHLIIAAVGKHTNQISVIPQNYEQFISFSYGHTKFLDSASFLLAGLDTLVKNLYEDGLGKHKFTHTLQHCKKKKHVDLLMRKGVYPYEYMDSWERFEETQLPPKERFFSTLNDCAITDADYEHAQLVWEKFGIKNLGEYHDLYVETDVLLLADVFENFRTLCITDDKLDPAHYYTLPNYSWDAMLKKTEVRLELLTDYDMHIMIESGLRGGVAMISNRHAVANNPYIQKYDKEKEHSYISYVDSNNLYGLSMAQALPKSDFEWSEIRDVDVLIKTYAQNPSEGCFVKCDLRYPEELHDEHSDYPLAPERKLVTNEMLSPYAAAVKTKLEIADDTCEKLVPNLCDKERYVLDIRNLAYYVEKGMEVTKVHKVITFKQEEWLKPYIDSNTAKRAKAKNDFEKDYYKLKNNAVFGKCMENLRGRVDMQFVTSYKAWGKKQVKKDATVERKIASPLYDGHIIYNEHLTAIKMKKPTLVLNKPIYAGMCILDLSKLTMYQFHYDVIKKEYGDKAQLLMTDTDSLCYHIKTDDVYKDIYATKELYDLSNFPKDSPYYDATNKKVLGKMKDENEGKAVEEFVGLRPKMYSMLDGNSSKEKKTGKGIKKAYLKNNVGHADYRNCIVSDKREDQQQKAKFQCIRSKKHQISTYEINKVGLCCYDNKRYILENGVDSLAYGHYKIPPQNISQ